MHKIFSFATQTSSGTLGMTNVVDINKSPLCAKKEMWTSSFQIRQLSRLCQHTLCSRTQQPHCHPPPQLYRRHFGHYPYLLKKVIYWRSLSYRIFS